MVSREENGLYRLDPTTQKIERQLAEYNFDDYYPNFTISNNVLFVSAISDVSVPIYSLIQYHIDDGEISTRPIPAKLQEDYQSRKGAPNPSFVDSHKRVWFGARGWLDLVTHQWHYIIPDPVFISVVPGAGEWRWVEPEPMLETSDGLIWYKALQATGWADPSKGVWCTFTSYSSNIFMDNFQRLWILVNDTLYMRQ